MDEKRVEKLIKKVYPDADILFRTITSESGTKYGCTIRLPEKNLAPMVYFNPNMQRSDEWFASMILQACDGSFDALDIDAQEIFTKFYFLEHVMPQAISYNRGFRFISERDLAHKQFFDLAIIFRVEIENDSDDIHSFKVTNSHLNSLHITMHELMEAARSNMVRKLKSMTMNDLLHEDLPMTIVTNERNFYGAAAIFLPETARKYKDCYIFCMSVHELVAIDAKIIDASILKCMVTDVNQMLRHGEYLSDTIFYSDGERISVAA